MKMRESMSDLIKLIYDVLIDELVAVGEIDTSYRKCSLDTVEKVKI